MTSNIINRYSLQPITSTFFPVASNTNIVELFGTTRIRTAARKDVVDVVFNLPVKELESGMVYLTGASNLYFVRFFITEDNTLFPHPSLFYFSVSYVTPFSIRLFGSLNVLSQNLKKSCVMYQNPMSPRRYSGYSFPAMHFLTCATN